MFVFVKFPGDTQIKAIDFSQLLQPGETVVSAVVSATNPTGLTVSVSSVASPNVNLSIGPGTDGITYGFNVVATTSLPRQLTQKVAVSCNSQLASQYQTRNPEAFNTLLGEIDSGDSAIGRAVFSFPTSVDPIGGFVTWTLYDQNGVEYSQGNAFDYTVTSNGLNHRVEALAVVNVPADIPTTLDGQSYQIRWTLLLNDQQYFSFENLRVTALNTVPQGAGDAVEMAGDTASLQLVLDRAYETVQLEVYQNNELLVPAVTVVSKQRVADGYLYKADIDTSAFPGGGASLDPYTVSWVYMNSASGSAAKNRQISRLYVVNASILQATEQVRDMINKAVMTIAHRQDMVFTVETLLSFLARGRDGFNSAWGIFTNFSMLNAKGPIRYWWLRYAEIHGLRSQFLAEGEKAFNFQGQAISLDVDRTQFYSQLADTMQSEVDNQVKPVKQNLIKKGVIGGDGSTDPTALQHGAFGAVGITITPASQGGGKYPRFWGLG